MGIRDILLYLWQLPQNLLGLVLTRIMGPGPVREYRNARVLLSEKMSGGISLGRYIIISSGFDSPDTARHEWGHCRQSLMLGPCYLLVIGLPSLLWAAWWKPGKQRGYFTFYTERWADRLAGIKRRPFSAGRKTRRQR